MPEGSPEPVSMSSPPPPPPRRRKGGGAKIMFVVLIVLALAGVIIYLLSLLNSKKFFLAVETNELVVKKGIFFPMGSELYKGKDAEEEKLYGPIELPEEFKHGGEREFADLPSLNHEWGRYLIELAEKMVFENDEGSFQKGKSYLGRVSHLKGLNAEQLKDIQGLNADVSYLEGKRAYQGVESTLDLAHKKFQRSQTFGTGRFNDAGDWIRKIDALLEVIRMTKATGLPVEVPKPEEKADPALDLPLPIPLPPDKEAKKPPPAPEPEEEPVRPSWRPPPPSTEEGI